MEIIKGIANKIRPEEWLAGTIFIIVVLLNSFIFPNDIGIVNGVMLMVRYFTYGDPFFYLFFSVVCIIAVLIFYTNTTEILKSWIIDKKYPSKETILEFLSNIFQPFRYIIPLWLVSGPMYLLLSNISYVLRDTKSDITLAKLDLAIFGRLFFIDLPTKLNTELINNLFYYFYTSLSLVIGLFLIFLLFTKEKYLLRLSTTAFIISNILVYPIYYVVPAQGPLYSLISNVRNISLPTDLQVELDVYNPSQYTEKTSERILNYYVDETNDNASPVSSFPSMHATWAMIISYILWRVRKYTLFITVPWAVIMLTGGLYFAQHFLIDYFVSIPIAIASIFLSYRLVGPKNLEE